MFEYLLTESKSGVKTLCAKDIETNREVRIHSAYDPIKEAERAVQSFSPGRASLVIVSGLGLGYHVELLKKNFRDKKFLVFEFSNEVIALCKRHNPECLKDIELVNSIGELNLFFDNINIAHLTGVSVYVHRPSYQLNPDFYDEMIETTKLNISSRVSDLLTRFEFEEKWIENIFKNIGWLSKVPSVSILFNRFKGYPGVIVSAGPSLRESLDLLEKIKDRAIILCVDTAFKVLHKYGIEPHFVMTLDSQKYSFKHFTGVKSKSTILISDVVGCPSILRYYSGRKIISTTAKYYKDKEGSNVRETTPIMDWIERNIGTIGDVQSGGSVATSAFDLLLNMGCDPIILIGQDLAYTGREIHCSGTYHNDDWCPQINRFKNLDTINQNIIRKRKIKYVDRFNSDGVVISDFVFDLYRNWFEDSSFKVKAQVINCNSGGAKIEHTKELLPEELNLSKHKRPPQEVIDEIYSHGSLKNFDRFIEKISLLENKLFEIERAIPLNITDEEKFGIIDEILQDNDLNEVLRPLMRKSEFYIARHNPDEKKRSEMIYNEIVINSAKLKKFFIETKRFFCDNNQYES